jgi:beta-lactamase class A
MMWPEDRSVFSQPVTRQIGAVGYPTTVEDLVRRSLVESDNAANDKLIALVGGVEAVAAALESKTLSNIRIGADEKNLQSTIAGLVWEPGLAGWRFKEAREKLPRLVREAALNAYLADPLDGASPTAIVKALAALKRGELLSEKQTEVMLRYMGQSTTGPLRLKGGLPADWTIAHKTGTGQDYGGASVGINDVGLLTAPDERVYAVAVMMPRTWAPVPRRLAFMQAVSQLVVQAWATESAAKGDPAR